MRIACLLLVDYLLHSGAHSRRKSYFPAQSPDLRRGLCVINPCYDGIGNLVRDSAEGITKIAWTVYGKIDSIYKAGGTLISYRYDAGGNRILKKVNNTETVYVRDASGNVMSTYSYDSTGLWQKEIHLYGSSRLGIANAVTKRPVPIAGHANAKTVTFTRGEKFFELTNHLVNVPAVVADKKLPVGSGGEINF